MYVKQFTRMNPSEARRLRSKRPYQTGQRPLDRSIYRVIDWRLYQVDYESLNRVPICRFANLEKHRRNKDSPIVTVRTKAEQSVELNFS